MSATWSWLTGWLRSRKLTRIAVEHARKQGVDVNNYVVSGTSSGGGECWVMFEGKSRRVGDRAERWTTMEPMAFWKGSPRSSISCAAFAN